MLLLSAGEAAFSSPWVVFFVTTAPSPESGSVPVYFILPQFGTESAVEEMKWRMGKTRERSNMGRLEARS